MAITKTVFSNLEIGTKFTLADETVEHVKVAETRGSYTDLNGKPATAHIKKTAVVSVFRPDPTPEELAAQQDRWVRRFFKSEIESTLEIIQKFKDNLEQNPAYAFEWCDLAAEAAAKMDTYVRLQSLYEDQGLDVTYNEAMKMALQNAKYPSRSTSVMTNYAKECKTAAFAEFAEKFAPRNR
jgi:hypothetical protein